MRVISGTAKGHRLKAPDRKATRPATDIVKGAMFSILENMDIYWDDILDLYSGSGQLGIEALSRGAGFVDFVDHSPACCAIIKENLEKTRFTDSASVHCWTVDKAFSFFDKEYDIILIDPPYPDRSIDNIIEKLAETRLVGDHTVVVVTHSPHFPLKEQYLSLDMIRENRHGDSCISLFRKRNAS